MLSPLAPACNIGQVFAQENFKPFANNPFASPLEMDHLNQNLLVGEDEVTSPLNFLEKSSTMETPLDMMSPPAYNHAPPPYHHRPNEYAPMV